MLKPIKKQLYFLVAGYFAWWARLVLARWKPTIVLVTGSAGKTTVFCLLEAQLREQAEFAYDANSAFGIPFDILHLKRRTFSYWEWLKLVLLAPWMIWKKETRKKIYVVEADVDRAKEGEFLAKLLKPDYVLLTNISLTHAENFDDLVRRKKFATVREAIAAEFLNFVKWAKKRAYVNGDNQTVMKEIEAANWDEQIMDKIVYLQQADYLSDYLLTRAGTTFVINGRACPLPYLLPQAVGQGLAMTQIIVNDLKLRMDESYQNLRLPAGRSQLLRGVKNTTLIDSSYNASPGSMRTMIEMFEAYPGEHKWLVLGHMIELGEATAKEHENLAGQITNLRTMERVILIGKDNEAWTVPFLRRFAPDLRVDYYEPAAALAAIRAELQGGEVLLLKGSPYMEAIVEGLLADPNDTQLLVRREKVYQKRREKFYGKAST